MDPASNGYYDYSKAYERGIDDIYQITMSVGYKINKRKITHELFLNIDNTTNNRGRLTEYYDLGKPGYVGHMRPSAAFPNLIDRMYF